MIIYRVFLIDICNMEHFGPVVVREQIGSEGVAE